MSAAPLPLPRRAPDATERPARPRALIVEDDARARDAVARVLRELPRGDGFDVDVAGSGEEGLEVAARGGPYVVAFLDVGLPGIDGHETAQRLWQLDPELRVVLFSGQHRLEVNQHDEAALERTLVLKKPVAAIELQQVALALSAARALADAEASYEAELSARVEAQTALLAQASLQLEREAKQRAQVEQQLASTERLRFVGELASSLALEINGPLQYVRDSVVMLDEVRTDLLEAYEAVGALLDPSSTAPWAAELSRDRLERDLGLTVEELGESMRHSTEGLERVTEIVDALKQLAQPDVDSKGPTDLRRVVETALTLTRNQHKYVAELETQLDEVPEVHADASALQQVVINLIVNAAHAMEDRAAGTTEMGLLRVRTFATADGAAVSIEDTGGGIPEAVLERMYDPFFTTKEVGRGTGQGLSIARSIVVDGHGGELTCETVAGVGTKFTVTLPSAPNAREGG